MKVIKVKYIKLLNCINNLVILQEIKKKWAGIPLSNINDIISKVVSHCKTCQQCKKPFPRLTVGLFKATYFNDAVAMDLHQLGPNLWYLHLSDEFSRFSNAVIISKSTDIIMNMFLKYWINLFVQIQYLVITEVNLYQKNLLTFVKTLTWR